MRVNGVILAAGAGKRIGGGTSKAFLPVAGRPLILHTLRCFASSKTVRKVILVLANNQLKRCQDLISSECSLRDLRCLFQPGGKRRQDSVRKGLERLDEDCEVVAIHDGARPFVSPRLIDRCVKVAFRKGSVVSGLPVRDTIKMVTGDGRVRETPPRDSLWEIQTPQVFRVDIIREAYLRADQEGVEATDDAMLVERLGGKVVVLKGQPANFKVTFPEDLLLADAILRKKKPPQGHL